MKPAVCVMIALGLGCSGLGEQLPEAVPVAPEPPVAPVPVEPPPSDWVTQAVELALEAEVMPGTEGGDSPERAAELRTFFLAHPEYQDRARLDVLLEDACADGVEGMHERLLHPPKKEPVVVDVDSDDWRLVVVHTDHRCTSDDWGWYTAQVAEGLAAWKVPSAYAHSDNDVVVVRRAGQEVARFPLKGQGYALFGAGREPAEVDHDMSDSVLAQIASAFGLPAPP